MGDFEDAARSMLPAEDRAEYDLRMARGTGFAPPLVEPPPACPVCNGTGLVAAHSEPSRPWEVTNIRPCPNPECGDGADHRRIAQDRRYRRSGLDGYPGWTFEEWDEEHDQRSRALGQGWAFDVLHSPEEAAPFLWLCGGFHTGKTFLAAAIGWFWVGEGKDVFLRIETEMFDGLKGAFDDETRSFEAEWAEIMDVPFLIYDDLGKEVETPWVARRRFDLLNHRMQRRLPTVATTNMRVADLDRALPRFAPRIRTGSLCMVLPMEEQYVEVEREA